MTQPQTYRARAIALKARARQETDPLLREKYEQQSVNYFSLAELAEQDPEDLRQGEIGGGGGGTPTRRPM